LLCHVVVRCAVAHLPVCLLLHPPPVKINDPTAEGDAGADGDGKASFEFADFDEVDVDEI
jgi:hypothetical protein